MHKLLSTYMDLPHYGKTLVKEILQKNRRLRAKNTPSWRCSFLLLLLIVLRVTKSKSIQN